MADHLRVHIVPVGHDSTRITEPLLSKKADRVYFIRHVKDKRSRYYDFITKELKNKVEIREEFVDIWDLFKCIEKFKEIVNLEKDNHLYVNVSTGSKISAIAGMFTSMLLKNVEPYYVDIEYPPQEITEVKKQVVKKSIELPVFGINQPKKTFLTVLNILSKHGKMNKSKLIEELMKNSVIKQKDITKNPFTVHAKHSQLRAILDPMERNWDFVKIEGRGRSSKVEITPQGKFALRIFSSSTDPVV